MSFPWITVPGEPGPFPAEEIRTPSWPLPEMTLPAPEAEPPMVLSGESSTETPPLLLALACVPVTSVPM